MKLKLLSPHVIGDRWYPAGAVLDPAPPGYQPTPMMEGLDDEARAAVSYAKLKAFGRYPWPYGFYPPGYGGAAPLDDPPIPRPLERQPAGVSLRRRPGVSVMPLSTDEFILTHMVTGGAVNPEPVAIAIRTIVRASPCGDNPEHQRHRGQCRGCGQRADDRDAFRQPGPGGAGLMDTLLAAALVLLHRVDGGAVLINPDQVTSLHARSGASNKHLTEQAQCAIWLSDGKLVSVVESCPQVQRLLEEIRR